MAAWVHKAEAWTGRAAVSDLATTEPIKRVRNIARNWWNLKPVEDRWWESATCLSRDTPIYMAAVNSIFYAALYIATGIVVNKKQDGWKKNGNVYGNNAALWTCIESHRLLYAMLFMVEKKWPSLVFVSANDEMSVKWDFSEITQTVDNIYDRRNVASIQLS